MQTKTPIRWVCFRIDSVSGHYCLLFNTRWPLPGHVSLTVLSCNTPDCSSSPSPQLHFLFQSQEEASMNQPIEQNRTGHWLWHCQIVCVCIRVCVSVLPHFSSLLKYKAVICCLSARQELQRPRELKVKFPWVSWNVRLRASTPTRAVKYAAFCSFVLQSVTAAFLEFLLWMTSWKHWNSIFAS